MQPLARQGLTDDEVRAILTSPDAEVRWGIDVLDLDGVQVDALDGASLDRWGSPIGTYDASACKIDYNLNRSVHRLVQVSLTRPIPWRECRIRPWQSVGGVVFSLGLFDLDVPTESALDGTVVATGSDMLVNLQPLIGQTRVLAWDGSAHVPTSFTALMRQTIEDAAIPGARHQIDSASDAVVTDAPQCWPAASQGGASWLRCINDLGQQIAYRGLYADEEGAFRSEPYRAPTERASEWSFRTGAGGDALTDIVSVDRQATTDGWNLTNWWRGVRRGMSSRPVEGAGVYTVDRTDGGRRVPFISAYDVSSQSALQLLVDNQVVRDTTRATSVRIKTSALPCLGHADVVDFFDGDLGIDGRGQITAFTHDLPAGTSDMTIGIL